jgi:hypothetical protein
MVGGGEGGWRRLQNEELHNLCASENIIRVTKSRRMRWIGHGRNETHTVLRLENLKRRDHSEELGVGGRIIILERILGK